MAGDHRSAPDPLALLAELEREPWRFGFLQTLRQLECLQPDRPRIASSAKASDDPIRLGQTPSMLFAPAELAALQRREAGRMPRLLVHFLGLLGPNGPLPLHLTDYARDRMRNSADPTFARFLDLFNHRMLGLFYRAWGQAQPAVSFDRPDGHRFGVYLGALQGLGLPSDRNRDAMPDLLRLHYTGHLACQTRHPEGLRSILCGFLGLPVQIEEFIGHWLMLPANYCWRLGESPQTGALGQTTSIGARVWDHQSKFRIRVGPLGLADYQRLLPGGESLTRIKAIVHHYLGGQLIWDLNPVLKQPEVPEIRLGQAGRLGWTTWLMSRPLGRLGDDLKLDPGISDPKPHPPRPATGPVAPTRGTAS